MAPATSTDDDRHRRLVETTSGPASYVDIGSGPPAVFVHGVGTSSYLWRRVIQLIAAGSTPRRCIAVDLPAHGCTPAGPAQDLTLGGLATFVADLCDALGLGTIDLVANDTGGAIAQIFAARQPSRLRTLTLTDCDTHDQVPPKAFRPVVRLARAGLLAPIGRWISRDPGRARKRMFTTSYEAPDKLPEDQLRAWVANLATRDTARQYQRLVAGLRPDDLLAVEPQLARLQVPTLIVWGTDDVFFPLADAYWLRDLIPGAGEVVQLTGARLFFPDERAAEFAAALLPHWAAHTTVLDPTDADHL